MTDTTRTEFYKTIRDLVVTSAIKAVVWSIGFLIVWALHTSYSMDTKIENVNKELNGKLVNSQNEAVLREAQLHKEIDDLRTEVKNLRAGRPPSITMPPLPPAPTIETEPRLNATQAPLDYIKENIKKH
jgi:hypothetical protein